VAKKEEMADSAKTRSGSALDEICRIGHKLTGVQLSGRHQEMVKARLTSRINDLGLKGLAEYLDYLRAHPTLEEPRLVSLITTHHTFFFREFVHFEFVQKSALPSLIEEARARPDRKIRVFSAACSRGQEVYSLAMFLDFHLKTLAPDLSFEVVGADVDPESVMIAQNGVYQRKELKEAPLALLANHWAKGTGEIAEFVKARESLRTHCRFEVENLLDGNPPIGMGKFDLIFCRNVFIYFNPSQIQLVVRKLLNRLTPGGYLCVGVSETLNQLELPIQSVGSSIYRRANAVAPVVKVTPAPEVVRSLRVLCVDDSPVILSLLKKQLTPDLGFEVVGTAANGLEAAARVAELKPDIMTLDIHMPQQTGIEYLAKNFRAGHPPVVMVSSVSREDSDLAGQAFALGASDYVEKPALSNILERADEIRTKLRCAFEAGRRGARTDLSVDRSFQRKLPAFDPAGCLIVVGMNLSGRDALNSLLRDLSHPRPPMVVLVDGARDSLSGIARVLGQGLGTNVEAPAEIPSSFKPGQIYLFDLSAQASTVAGTSGGCRAISVMVLGELADRSAEKLVVFEGSQLLLEDSKWAKEKGALRRIASDIVPATSFAYLAGQYFANTLAQGKAG
jgi:chemotaxis protein methyltransferase CheR